MIAILYVLLAHLIILILIALYTLIVVFVFEKNYPEGKSKLKDVTFTDVDNSTGGS